MKRRTFLASLAGAVVASRCATRTLAGGELAAPTADQLSRYTWLDPGAQIRPLDRSIAAPAGYARVKTDASTFGAWLRELPLRGAGTPVKSFAGDVLHQGNDARISAVVEIDCGKSDLQQCADSAIRMHAEWLWSRGDKASIAYHFLSGDFATYLRYAAGERPSVSGNKVVWRSSAKPSDDRATFRRYLDMVFMYASTISLAKESRAVERGSLAAGDFFIQAGSPGHTVLVLDVAENATGERAALLGQGYMPAQDFQVLASGESIGPWFSLEGDEVATPFWDPFPWKALQRFPKHAK
jgi:hypothetical protein